MLVVIEGMDRVGKSSTIAGINKKSKYHYYCLDRGPAGFTAYDIILKRETEARNEMYKKDADDFNKIDSIFIYLYADPEIIKSRLIDEGVSIYPNDISVEETLSLYETFIDSMYNKDRVLKINTSNISKEEVVDKVISFIESF